MCWCPLGRVRYSSGVSSRAVNVQSYRTSWRARRGCRTPRGRRGPQRCAASKWLLPDGESAGHPGSVTPREAAAERGFSMSVVVTGATGQLGRLTVEALPRRGVPATDVVATGRDTAGIKDLATGFGWTRGGQLGGLATENERASRVYRHRNSRSHRDYRAGRPGAAQVGKWPHVSAPAPQMRKRPGSREYAATRTVSLSRRVSYQARDSGACAGGSWSHRSRCGVRPGHRPGARSKARGFLPRSRRPGTGPPVGR